MHDDWNTLSERIHALPDEQLIDLLEQEADQYTPEAITIAEIEAETRGGLLHLKQEQALTRLEQEPPEPNKHLLEKLFSKLRGRPPSEKYPGLSNIALAMRLLSFLVVLLGVVHAVGGLYNFLAGNSEWWWSSIGWIQIVVAFLLFYGGSELITVVLDIEENTRQGAAWPQEETKPPGESA